MNILVAVAMATQWTEDLNKEDKSGSNQQVEQ